MAAVRGFLRWCGAAVLMLVFWAVMVSIAAFAFFWSFGVGPVP